MKELKLNEKQVEALIEKTAIILADKFYDSKIFEESIKNKGLISYDDKIQHKLIELIQSKQESRTNSIEQIIRTESQSYKTIVFIINEFLGKMNNLRKAKIKSPSN